MGSTFVVRTPSAGLAVTIRGEGPQTVVLLHGGLGWPDYLEPLALLLRPAYRVVSFDQRGVGRSRAYNGRFAVEDYLEDLEALQRALETDRIHLLGHDRGGVLAQLYALRHPSRLLSVALLNSALGTREEWLLTRRESARRIRRRSSFTQSLALSWWSLTSTAGPWADPAARRAASHLWCDWFSAPSPELEPGEKWLKGVKARAARRTDKGLRRSRQTLPSRWEPDFPMLVLYGDDDLYHPAAQDVVRLRFPHAGQVTLTECGHLPWLEAPGACAALLQQFYDVPEPAAA
jgi:pimeloyl-ACP methyl ester carboxylesterase